MMYSDRHDSRKIRVFGACVTGLSHIRTGEECQDAWKTEVIPDLGSGRAVIALSDGLGSALHAKKGSHIAVTAAISYLTENPGNVLDTVCYARQELIRQAQDLAITPGDLACTLVVIELTEERVLLAHVGDGVVIGRENESGPIILLSDPGPSEYINEVIPLTAVDSINHIRYREKRGINTLVAVTDGCQGALLIREAGQLCPFEPFIRPLFEYYTHDMTEDMGTSALYGLLNSDKMKTISDDDKTMVIAVIS